MPKTNQDGDLQPLPSATSCVLLLGDPTISPPALGRVLDAVEKKWPTATVAGMLAAPGSGASVWANGKPVSGGFAGLVLPFRATAALDLIGCKAVGNFRGVSAAWKGTGNPSNWY